MVAAAGTAPLRSLLGWLVRLRILALEVALGVGTEVHEPDRGVGIVHERQWVHVVVVVHRKEVLLFHNGERIYSGLLSEKNMYAKPMQDRQHGVCFIGLPPSDLMNYSVRTTFFGGFLYNVLYHQAPQPTPFWENWRREIVSATPYRVKKCVRRLI